ncbi:hypothetical protein O181_062012 [Austropuccinia psidii MF-1]|uniref:Uncharacterized protein n=1 Tax=Austropuccinia psidii MF-1 TaxID=1389203 RepID=A0A9Q3HZZ1_9BASI|nr:hypothetical protein [Austropuccinia psidii MF-1]
MFQQFTLRHQHLHVRGDLSVRNSILRPSKTSVEGKRAAKRWCWEEHAPLEKEFPDDLYLQEAAYAHNGGKIAATQHQCVAGMLVAATVADKMGISVGDALGYLLWFSDCSSRMAVLDGMLLLEIMTGRALARYTTMIIDESQLSYELIVSSHHPRYSKCGSKLLARSQTNCV